LAGIQRRRGTIAGYVLPAQAPRAQFLGLELSRTGVDTASRRVPAARFLQRDLLSPARPGDGLDFLATHALCSDVLEHLDDPGLLLRNAAAYMAPGCKLVATVPGGWYSAFYDHIGHRRHYSPAQLTGLLESAGFAVSVLQSLPYAGYAARGGAHCRGGTCSLATHA
jgi:trans-aconitate methyltransferase